MCTYIYTYYIHIHIGHSHDISDVEIYQMSVKSGIAHLRCDGPDPGRVAMQRKVENLHLANTKLMRKIQDLADRQVGGCVDL